MMVSQIYSVMASSGDKISSSFTVASHQSYFYDYSNNYIIEKILLEEEVVTFYDLEGIHIEEVLIVETSSKQEFNLMFDSARPLDITFLNMNMTFELTNEKELQIVLNAKEEYKPISQAYEIKLYDHHINDYVSFMVFVPATESYYGYDINFAFNGDEIVSHNGFTYTYIKTAVITLQCSSECIFNIDSIFEHSLLFRVEEEFKHQISVKFDERNQTSMIKVDIFVNIKIHESIPHPKIDVSNVVH